LQSEHVVFCWEHRRDGHSESTRYSPEMFAKKGMWQEP
jgi:hypothetical protein